MFLSLLCIVMVLAFGGTFKKTFSHCKHACKKLVFAGAAVSHTGQRNIQFIRLIVTGCLSHFCVPLHTGLTTCSVLAS